MGERDRTSHRSMRRIRNIGIIAHIDAGKTTLTERLLFITGKTHKMGEVHDGEAVMDYMVQEQERGITITSAVTSFEWRDHEVHLVDTPGHVDFTIEVERSLRVLDGAVVVFDGVSGVEPQSETVWHQADRFGVPRIAFVNKLDRVGADFDAAVASMRSHFSQTILPVQIPVGTESSLRGVVDLVRRRTLLWDGQDPRDTEVQEGVPEELRDATERAREELVAALADFDEEVADRYLAGEEVPGDRIQEVLRRACISGKVVPVLCGSALRNRGVPPVLDGVVDWLPSPLDIPPVRGTHPQTGEVVERPHDPAAPFCALVYKVQVVDEGRRLTYLRIYSGRIREGDDAFNPGRRIQEKFSRIFLMHARDRKRLEEVGAGNIVGVLGLKVTGTGETLCDPAHPILLEPIRAYDPVISMAIEAEVQGDRERLEMTLRRIADEDPTFRFREDPDTGQTVMSGMGELHLDIVADRIRRDFRLPVRVGRPQVVYAETVLRAAEGEGVCEIDADEARVFARLRLRVEPAPRGTGNSVRGAAEVQASPALREAAATGVLEALQGGVLNGLPITDVTATLLGLEGREGYGIDDTAVKIAAMNAVKEVCGAAGTARMEPIGRIEVVCPPEYMGEVLGGLQARRGVIEALEDRGLVKWIRATAPIERMFGYATELRSATQGRGAFTMVFERYDVA
ncbi:MAG TPA: elongation factor G [Myxococcota bacterium]|nr:elongation factor G [Myxococcota bacterium]HQK52268.1 elongation factor G [Myxococcota bacterium]